MNIQHEFKQLNIPLYKSNNTIFEEPLAENTEIAEQVISEESNSSGEPDVHSEMENATEEERSVPSQPQTPSTEQSQASSCSAPGDYVPDTSVGCGGAGPPVTTSGTDINAFSTDLPDGTDSIISGDRGSSPVTSTEPVSVTGDSRDTAVILGVGTGESPGYHNHRLDSDMESNSTRWSTGGPIDQDILEGLRERVTGGMYPTSDSGHSTNTSAGGYICLPSSNHCSTED